MATKSTSTKSAATATAVHAVGPYRTNPAWLAAMGSASGSATGNPAYRAAVQVATHLAWRAPSGAVAWHKGTNAHMLATATEMGITSGMPVQAAMAVVVAAMATASTTDEQKAAADALAALVG